MRSFRSRERMDEQDNDVSPCCSSTVWPSCVSTQSTNYTSATLVPSWNTTPPLAANGGSSEMLEHRIFTILLHTNSATFLDRNRDGYTSASKVQRPNRADPVG